MALVYISIGSNIEPHKNVAAAVRQIRREFESVSVSPVYESAAVGFKGDDFLNLVIAVNTSLPLEDVNNRLVAIERRFGRKTTDTGFQSRTLDLDLLLYEDLIRHDDDFDLPRSDIGRYAFVLKPLCDIAPDLKHPETEKTIEQMWFDFSNTELLRPYSIDLA